MEWPEVIKLVGQLTTTAVLAILSWKLWAKLEAKDAEAAAIRVASTVAAEAAAAKLAAVNEARLADLRAMLRPRD